MRAVTRLSVIGILAGAVVATACGGGSVPPSGAAPGEAATGVWAAPEFDLVDLDGNPVRLADSAGKVRVIDFWATWCPPCVEEMPMFKELHDTYASRGVVVLGLSADEDVEDVRSFAAEHGLTWTNMVAPDEVREAYKVSGLPQTFVIDADGNVAKQFPAGVVPKRVLVEWIEKLLPPASGV